ncbi:coproporphyrinogen III oxidase [Maribius pontilimi]|uniref:Heme chaperone HemW n=1 Tax=Palleronia pontilimi TaxID=1964209 RepID=A0A934MCR4_9RHOB|nr:radical SAM family heme chaperone HemW [Palleronia pontilimi]MBJ3761551.1 coproporphyrinogen III oxidase [Palleronia pontilimi]
MTDRGFGIYIHWPFCQAKCPYCDFNSHVSARVDHDAWARAYLSELTRIRQLTGDRILRSVFFGGGTPSLMTPATVDAILDRIQRLWRLSNDVEITLEANPTSVEADRFRGYRAAGVNRVSMGLQALNDNDLKRLGRLHTVAEAQTAFDIARSCFDRISFDLIYARQDQSLADWQTELTRALDMAADHLSLYQLTIEPGTAFGDRFARGALRGLPGEDLSADMYELTQQLTSAAGMPAYEISNHARLGAESRHNMIYWTGGDYAGIGPGAHGRLTLDGTRYATEAASSPALWLSGTLEGRTPETLETLDPETVRDERLLMGLRVNDGVPLDIARQVIDYDKKIVGLEDLGLVRQTLDALQVTPSGRPLLNAILRELIA